MKHAPMKRSTWARRAAPAEKELNREQRLAVRAQRAIDSVADKGTGEKQGNRRSAHAVCAPVAMNSVAAIPKSEQHRNRRLLDLAQGMPCLLRIPGVCNRDPATTVAAHSNWAGFGGKAMGRKSSDAHTIWCCSACHIGWLDQGPAPKATKQMAFMRAHADQVLLWRQIATDPRRAPADRKAAQWALDLLKATPNTFPDLHSQAQVAINTGATEA